MVKMTALPKAKLKAKATGSGWTTEMAMNSGSGWVTERGSGWTTVTTMGSGWATVMAWPIPSRSP